jgi:diguanylate cyclase (GGDEF)-like protein
MTDIPVYVADRKSLFNDLEHFITAHQVAGKKLAILLININHFRQINVVYGYESGDRLLQEFVSRLRGLARQQDYIARMGNSEFILVLPEILNQGHATLAAHKLLSSLNEPFELGKSKHKVTADMGIALFPDHATHIVELIQKAEMALMDARRGIKSHAIYADKPIQDEFSIWDIEVELENALDRDEFELFFQPQVYLDTGELYGAEALIRWNNPARGYIRPHIFIPVSEKSGHIHRITSWTINTALRLFSHWPETKTPLKVAVNLSTRVLSDPDLVDSIGGALSIWGTKHEQLTLEVTESALMEEMTSSFLALDDLKTLGLNISIDDFGTGYSSMAYFKNIPASELKIDQSFVCYMLENTMDQHIVKTIVKMAHGFELKVIAEGIENLETLQALKTLGCDIGQGYYLAKPMPQDEFIQWLKNYDASAVRKAITAV